MATRFRAVGRRLLFGSIAVCTISGASLLYILRPMPIKHSDVGFKNDPILPNALPSRDMNVKRLKDAHFDLLVVGGGATGCGIALDAATRGLNVALIEKTDFAAQTSSKSTKLIHGGIRYLQKAFTELDYGQLQLVRNALRERKHLMHVAPHLTGEMPTLVPFYQSDPALILLAPYYYVGVKMYDFFAGDGLLHASHVISRKQIMSRFPSLKSEGLKGGVVYYDGWMNDARLCAHIGLTAAVNGAAVANYVELVDLIKDGERIVGACVRDQLSNQTWNIKAKMVINSTGPFVDHIRRLANSKLENLIFPSSGTHITIPAEYAPRDMGLIVPRTTDGRVLFLLPWEGQTIAGTTDAECKITESPQAHDKEVQWIIDEVGKFLKHPISRSEVRSAWSGIRPLARNPNAKDTQSLSRDHVIEVTAPGLITITGGKWTTYREMAEDAVDVALKNNAILLYEDKKTDLAINQHNLKPCHSLEVKLIGAAKWTPQTPELLTQLGLPQDIAEHLSHNYGDRAIEVAKIVQNDKLNFRLSNGYPFIEAEVLYACRHEYAQTAIDVIARRMRLSFIDADATLHALPRIIEIMAQHHKWNRSRRQQELKQAMDFVKQTMTVAL